MQGFRVQGSGFRVKEAFDAALFWLAFVPPSQIPITSDDAHSQRKEKEKEETKNKRKRKRRRKNMKKKKGKKKGEKKNEKRASKEYHPRWARKSIFYIRTVNRNRNEIDAQKTRF